MTRECPVEHPALLTPAQCRALAGVAEPELASTLADTLASLPLNGLPFSAFASRGGLIDADDWSLSTLKVDRTAATVSARLSLFFTEIVSGCNCHDAPSRFTDHHIVGADIELGSGRISWIQLDG